MPSRLGQKGSATGLKTIVFSGLLLLSGTATASFIQHTQHHVIAEPKLVNIPVSLRGHHPHHPHGSHRHRHRARFHERRAEGVVVEVPYTIWSGTFDDLKKRSPVAASKDDNSNSKTDSTSTDATCTGIACPKGSYCTDAGCCPNGKKCTGVTTCLDHTDSECPDNIACCPNGNPICQVSQGKGLCVKQKHEDPTTTSEPPKPTSSKVTKADATTTSKVTKEDVTTTSKEPKSTSTEDTTTSTTQTSSEAHTTAPPLALPTDATNSDVPTPIPEDNPSTTSTAPTPSSTEVTHDLSSTSKIISGAVAGSIVALAFGSLIIYAIFKKRKENALIRAEEEFKAAPMSAPASAAPMGSGGNGRPLSIQPEPEMLHMSPQPPAAVFSSGPQRGQSLRDGIPPPSPTPNAAVVGTPPYRREQNEPSTPTSLRAGIPGPQIAQPWNPVEGYSRQQEHSHDNEYPLNFPFAEESYGTEYHTQPVNSPSTPGSYQAYSPPSTPRYPPGTAHSPN